MKKNERLVSELFFINQKKQFNLADLMTEFSISRRTALRDIADLESLGAPITVDKGRFGGYQVIKNNSLPPLYLNQNEWHSLFLVLQLFQQIEESPFKSSYQELKNKLLALSPQKEIKINQQLERMVVIYTTQSISQAPFLTELFHAIFEEEVINMTYSRYQDNKRLIQPVQLGFKYGHWYLLAWDFNRDSFRQFRCDFIEKVTVSTKKELSRPFEELYDLYIKETTGKRPFSFKARLRKEGLTLFHQKQYPGITLITENDTYFMVGNFHENEIPFLINYFIGFGTFLKLEEPKELVDFLKIHLTTLRDQYD